MPVLASGWHMGFRGEGFCQGSPPTLTAFSASRHRDRPLGARADDAAGEDDKRPELQVQVQE